MRYYIDFHYPTSDVGCTGEYWRVDVMNDKDELLTQYGDYYHDKGSEKALAFLEGMQYLLNDPHREIIYRTFADIED